jgi:hypothetical protein
MLFHKWQFNIILVLMSLTITFVISEITFRSLLFSDLAFMQRFRNPSLYSDNESDDYWKLYYLFRVTGQDRHFLHKGQVYGEIHPLLGWGVDGSFLKDTYEHPDTQHIGGRRPVLLYGDSFASCASMRQDCFQQNLNKDKEFSKSNYLLNYGVGGYGVDQIYLLFMNSIHLYRHPFVVLSLMTHDLDRSLLSVREGVMKPYFEVVGDQLVLRREHVNQDRMTFFTENPPEVVSYLYRLWLYRDGHPGRLRMYLSNSEEKRRHNIEINKIIIISIINELRKNQIEYVFLVFHPMKAVENDDWRNTFLEKLLMDNGAPFLLTKQMIKKDAMQKNKDFQEYFLPDGHPNKYQNEIIAGEIKRFIMEHGNIRASHSKS